MEDDVVHWLNNGIFTSVVDYWLKINPLLSNSTS